MPLEDRGWTASAPEDVAAFQGRFLRLLERRTALYTMGESTSVPAHVAADLIRSACFVLGIDPNLPEMPDKLLVVDLEDEFRRGLAEIERRVQMSGTLWRKASTAMPSIPNTALRDTLASVGDFPRLYDFRHMAHEIPCVFDYPLCHSVSETLLGVDYINEYLRRLIVEFELLGRFDRDVCVRVLERSSPDYVDLLVNLYEPIATNAIGRMLIGRNPRSLLISEEDRVEIAQVLQPLHEAGQRSALLRAALAVRDSIGLDDRGGEYLFALAPELLPRIQVGLARGGLRGVFF